MKNRKLWQKALKEAEELAEVSRAEWTDKEILKRAEYNYKIIKKNRKNIIHYLN